jgi:hypothetical protein
MSEQRYDVSYGANDVRIESHFCREFDADDNGCFGTNTNPNHGFSFDEAKKMVADWHRQQAEYFDKVSKEAYFTVRE